MLSKWSFKNPSGGSIKQILVLGEVSWGVIGYKSSVSSILHGLLLRYFLWNLYWRTRSLAFIGVSVYYSRVSVELNADLLIPLMVMDVNNLFPSVFLHHAQVVISVRIHTMIDRPYHRLRFQNSRRLLLRKRVFFALKWRRNFLFLRTFCASKVELGDAYLLDHFRDVWNTVLPVWFKVCCWINVDVFLL